MTKAEVQTVDHGLYVIFWKDGGSSLASVGSNAAGRRWFAPTNWVSTPWFDWRKILRVRRIHVSSEVKGTKGC